jgi:pimeloyl-ACP methyl ester carboxylesterase
MTVPSLDREGITIHYEVHGTSTDRIPLLLTHGYSASSAMWEPNLGALSAHRQVITWDIRGHGESDSPTEPSSYSEQASVADMAAILDVCGVARAAIGGLSLGGYLSLAFGLAHPASVAALLLFDTGPGFKQDIRRQQWNEQAEAFAVAFSRDGLKALSSSPEVSRGAHNPTGLALAARGILTQRDPSVITSLPHIAVPTLVLVGEADRPFLAATDYMAAKIPGAIKVVIPDAGHASNIDQPKAFNQAVNAFLDHADQR